MWTDNSWERRRREVEWRAELKQRHNSWVDKRFETEREDGVKSRRVIFRVMIIAEGGWRRNPESQFQGESRDRIIVKNFKNLWKRSPRGFLKEGTSDEMDYLPVLKHGPRSLTWMRMWMAENQHMKRNQNTMKRRELLAIVSFNRWSKHVRTRKMVNYTWTDRSRRKLWWKIHAVLTCKLLVIFEYRGERLIELSSSWFHLNIPLGRSKW